MDLINHYSYLGLFAILFIEEAGIPIPIPGDLFIGTIAALPNSSYFLTVTTVMAATVSGSTILFTIAKKFGRKILVKFGPKVKITPDKIKKVEKWFSKYGMWTIVIGRLIPGFRTITPFAAGLFDLPYQKFWGATVIAAFIWANIYYVIGKFFSELITKLYPLFTKP